MDVEFLPGIHALLIESNFTAVIINSSDAFGNVCIPRFFKYNNDKYTITTIGENAFKNAKRLTKISFAQDSAVTNIENNAFKNCSITHLSLPPKLELLDENWCSDANNIITIRIPTNTNHESKIKLIDEKFLIGSSLLTSKFFCNFITGNYITGNFLHGKDGLINRCNELFFACRDIIQANIPSNIRIINNFSFQNCKKLESLSFSGDSIEEIRREAFSGCTKLKNIIVFPKSLQRISYAAFRNNESLRSLIFQSDSIIFESYCFQGCSKLEEITTRASTITINQFAFDENVTLFIRKGTIIHGIDFFRGQIIEKDTSAPTLKASKSEPVSIKRRVRGMSDLLLSDHALEKKDRYISYLQNILSSKQIDYTRYESFEKVVRSSTESYGSSNNNTGNNIFNENETKIEKENEKKDEHENSTKEDDVKDSSRQEQIDSKESIKDEEINYKQIEKVSHTDIYDIWLVNNTRTNQILSKLILNPSEFVINSGIPQKMCQEFEISQKINHPCICKGISINSFDTLLNTANYDNNNQQSATTYSFYFENVSQHLKFILDDNLKINNTKKTIIAIEILCGMIYLLKIGIYHENLTIDNILLNENYEAKIMLFSIFDREKIKENSNNTSENFDLQRCEDSYTYSFGVILYELFVGSRFEEKNKENQNELSPSESVSQFCLDLIKNCLSPDHSNIPKLEILLSAIIQREYNLAEGVNSKDVDKRYKEIIMFEKNNVPNQNI